MTPPRLRRKRTLRGQVGRPNERGGQGVRNNSDTAPRREEGGSIPPRRSPQLSRPTNGRGKSRFHAHFLGLTTDLSVSLLGPNPERRPRATAGPEPPRPLRAPRRAAWARAPAHCACAGARRTEPSPEQGCARRPSPPAPWSRPLPRSRAAPNTAAAAREPRRSRRTPQAADRWVRSPRAPAGSAPSAHVLPGRHLLRGSRPRCVSGARPSGSCAGFAVGRLGASTEQGWGPRWWAHGRKGAPSPPPGFSFFLKVYFLEDFIY